MINLSILFVLLFATWVALSGIFTVSFLSLGVISCLLAVVFYRLIYKDKIIGLFVMAARMLWYFLWLIKEIAKSSLNVSLKMWQLDPEISPQVLWVPVNLRDDVALTIFANSITLTPGTVTIGTREGMLYVHSLTEEAMEDLKGGAMLNRVYKLAQVGE